MGALGPFRGWQGGRVVVDDAAVAIVRAVVVADGVDGGGVDAEVGVVGRGGEGRRVHHPKVLELQRKL